jgi:hypothetical protein
MNIRKATEADVPQLLPLMRELAEFEGYADAFAITEEVLREQGFRRSPPDSIVSWQRKMPRWQEFSFTILSHLPIGRNRI